MYVPPYEALRTNLAASVHANEARNMVSIPEALLKLLLQIAISKNSFDEAGYLKANPDVAAEVRLGKIASGHMHYLGYGYFEGREGGANTVDVAWYQRTYPDVAQAIASGRAEVRSVAEHYRVAGAAEGRAPSAAAMDDVKIWMKALGL